MEEKQAVKSILRIKYSYGPYFWIGACLLLVYYWVQLNREFWDLIAIFGASLVLLDRILCRFRRLKIYEHPTHVDPAYSEQIELDISVAKKFQVFNRQRGIFFGVAIVGFYSSFAFWYYAIGIERFYEFSGFYFWAAGVTLLLYQIESRDIYRWKKMEKRSEGQEFMMSNRAIYISVGLIKFSGGISALEKRFTITTSGHIMILWKDLQSWMLIKRPIFFLGPSMYFHELKFHNGRIIKIDRDHLTEHENSVLHHARKYVQVVVED